MDPTGSGLVGARIDWAEVGSRDRYPFSLPSLQGAEEIDLSAAVTFLVGENGSGKSTLLEALAVVAGLNPAGGSRNLRYESRPQDSTLDRHLVVRWSTQRPWAFFLRAETFFNTATAYEGVGEHAILRRSHGEQFIDAAVQRFRPHGLHLLDEPEAALSTLGELVGSPGTELEFAL